MHQNTIRSHLELADAGFDSVCEISSENISVRISLLSAAGQFSEHIFSGNDYSFFEVIGPVSVPLTLKFLKIVILDCKQVFKINLFPSKFPF